MRLILALTAMILAGYSGTLAFSTTEDDFSSLSAREVYEIESLLERAEILLDASDVYFRQENELEQRAMAPRRRIKSDKGPKRKTYGPTKGGSPKPGGHSGTVGEAISRPQGPKTTPPNGNKPQSGQGGMTGQFLTAKPAPKKQKRDLMGFES